MRSPATTRRVESGPVPTTPRSRSIRVAIVEGNENIRVGLAGILRLSPDLVLVGALADAESAIRSIRHSRPEVILMNLRLPGISGIECTRAVKQLLSTTEIIVYNMESNSNGVLAAIQAGACGYLTKDATQERLLEAIREASRGGAPMSQVAARSLVEFLQQRTEAICLRDEKEDTLSAREREVLQAAGEGLRVKEIADRLSISNFTVQSHVRKIYEKLGVRSLSQAIAKSAHFGRRMG